MYAPFFFSGVSDQYDRITTNSCFLINWQCQPSQLYGTECVYLACFLWNRLALRQLILCLAACMY
jgi:hypothetical protein